MANIFLHLLNMSLTAGVLVVAVVLLRLAFFKAPRWIHCLLWALVAVRLLCPFVIESDFSLMPSAATVPVSTLESTPEPPTTQPIVSDTPAPSNPVADIPVIDTPVVDTPVIDTPVVDTPVIDTPAVDTPIVNTVEKPSSNVTVSTPAPKADTNPWQTVLSVASWLWLAGMLAMAIYAAVTTLRLRRQVVEAAHLRDNLWQCDHLRSPFILGAFRPRIYLPSDLDGIARDSVVAHEQAHLHRHDHWWKPLGFLLLTVYWFNPLMWVAYILLCRDIEAACDERVVRNMNADSRRSYSEALLLCSAPRRLVSACPLAFGETSVKTRIKSVLSYKKPTIWIIVAALLVSTVAGVCLLTDPKPEDGKSDTKVSSTPEEDDPPEEPAVAPTHAVFTHTGEPKAQITLELNGNGCTYINSILSSAMPYEGTYVQSENGFLLSFPPTTMTIELNGDFTGLTLRMGQSDTHMSYEQMSYGGKELKNGAVFARTADVRAVSYAAPLTFSSGNWLGDEQLAEMRQKYQYRTGSNDNNDRPIIPITSRAELDAFIAEYEDAFSFNKAEGDGLTPIHQMSFYDDAFFAEKMLLAVYYRDGSFMIAPQIAAVEYNGAELVTVQVDVYAPAIQAQVLGQWFMLAEVPLDEIPYATAYRAVIRDRIPADYRWATYSHPVTVGDEGDVAVGYYSIFDYGRETLMPLVEGLEWYGADIMADTDFTYLGYFTIDGKKKYYVSPDKKQLYDGEQIADLTAEQSEQLDFYLRDGNPGEDAIAASVTGTVTEWSKEGGYIMLEVTEGDSKLGPRVMAYTTILMPGSAPAVGYPATIYYDGWFDGRGFGSAIYAIHREWQDADLLGGPEDDEPTDPGNPDDKWLNYTVIVRGEIGNPLSGVKINISSENIAETITTDSTGVAKARLPEGVPTGTIEVPQGYVAASKKFTFAAGSTSLTIVLEKEQPVTPPATPTISNPTVGETLVLGGMGTWRSEILEEEYGDYVVSYPLKTYPIKVLYSYEELHAFITRYAPDIRCLREADFTKFSTAWFEENVLLMIYYEDGSISVSPRIGCYAYSEDGTILSVGIDVCTPELCDDAIGTWFMFSGIKKADLEGIQEVTSYMRARIPEHYYVALFVEPTLHPQNAVEEWRTWLPYEERRDFTQLVSLGSFVDVTRACEYIAAINIGGENYYIAEDFAAILRDDGKLCWLTEIQANSIKRLIAVADQNRVLYEY